MEPPSGRTEQSGSDCSCRLITNTTLMQYCWRAWKSKGKKKEPFMFYVHYNHLQSWPVLCTTYKYMIKQMHRGYLQEPNNSLYTSKNENIKKGENTVLTVGQRSQRRTRADGVTSRSSLQGCDTERRTQTAPGTSAHTSFTPVCGESAQRGTHGPRAQPGRVPGPHAILPPSKSHLPLLTLLASCTLAPPNIWSFYRAGQPLCVPQHPTPSRTVPAEQPPLAPPAQWLRMEMAKGRVEDCRASPAQP